MPSKISTILATSVALLSVDAMRTEFAGASGSGGGTDSSSGGRQAFPSRQSSQQSPGLNPPASTTVQFTPSGTIGQFSTSVVRNTANTGLVRSNSSDTCEVYPSVTYGMSAERRNTIQEMQSTFTEMEDWFLGVGTPNQGNLLRRSDGVAVGSSSSPSSMSTIDRSSSTSCSIPNPIPSFQTLNQKLTSFGEENKDKKGKTTPMIYGTTRGEGTGNGAGTDEDGNDLSNDKDPIVGRIEFSTFTDLTIPQEVSNPNMPAISEGTRIGEISVTPPKFDIGTSGVIPQVTPGVTPQVTPRPSDVGSQKMGSGTIFMGSTGQIPTLDRVHSRTSIVDNRDGTRGSMNSNASPLDGSSELFVMRNEIDQLRSSPGVSPIRTKSSTDYGDLKLGSGNVDTVGRLSRSTIPFDESGNSFIYTKKMEALFDKYKLLISGMEYGYQQDEEGHDPLDNSVVASTDPSGFSGSCPDTKAGKTDPANHGKTHVQIADDKTPEEYDYIIFHPTDKEIAEREPTKIEKRFHYAGRAFKIVFQIAGTYVIVNIIGMGFGHLVLHGTIDSALLPLMGQPTYMTIVPFLKEVFYYLQNLMIINPTLTCVNVGVSALSWLLSKGIGRKELNLKAKYDKECKEKDIRRIFLDGNVDKDNTDSDGSGVAAAGVCATSSFTYTSDDDTLPVGTTHSTHTIPETIYGDSSRMSIPGAIDCLAHTRVGDHTGSPDPCILEAPPCPTQVEIPATIVDSAAPATPPVGTCCPVSGVNGSVGSFGFVSGYGNMAAATSGDREKSSLEPSPFSRTASSFSGYRDDKSNQNQDRAAGSRQILGNGDRTAWWEKVDDGREQSGRQAVDDHAGVPSQVAGSQTGSPCCGSQHNSGLHASRQIMATGNRSAAWWEGEPVTGTLFGHCYSRRTSSQGASSFSQEASRLSQEASGQGASGLLCQEQSDSSGSREIVGNGDRTAWWEKVDDGREQSGRQAVDDHAGVPSQVAGSQTGSPCCGSQYNSGLHASRQIMGTGGEGKPVFGTLFGHSYVRGTSQEIATTSQETSSLNGSRVIVGNGDRVAWWQVDGGDVTDVIDGDVFDVQQDCCAQSGDSPSGQSVGVSDPFDGSRRIVGSLSQRCGSTGQLVGTSQLVGSDRSPPKGSQPDRFPFNGSQPDLSPYEGSQAGRSPAGSGSCCRSLSQQASGVDGTSGLDGSREILGNGDKTVGWEKDAGAKALPGTPPLYQPGVGLLSNSITSSGPVAECSASAAAAECSAAERAAIGRCPFSHGGQTPFEIIPGKDDHQQPSKPSCSEGQGGKVPRQGGGCPLHAIPRAMGSFLGTVTGTVTYPSRRLFTSLYAFCTRRRDSLKNPSYALDGSCCRSDSAPIGTSGFGTQGLGTQGVGSAHGSSYSWSYSQYGGSNCQNGGSNRQNAGSSLSGLNGAGLEIAGALESKQGLNVTTRSSSEPIVDMNFVHLIHSGDDITHDGVPRDIGDEDIDGDPLSPYDGEYRRPSNDVNMHVGKSGSVSGSLLKRSLSSLAGSTPSMRIDTKISTVLDDVSGEANDAEIATFMRNSREITPPTTTWDHPRDETEEQLPGFRLIESYWLQNIYYPESIKRRVQGLVKKCEDEGIKMPYVLRLVQIGMEDPPTGSAAAGAPSMACETDEEVSSAFPIPPAQPATPAAPRDELEEQLPGLRLIELYWRQNVDLPPHLERKAQALVNKCRNEGIEIPCVLKLVQGGMKPEHADITCEDAIREDELSPERRTVFSGLASVQSRTPPAIATSFQPIAPSASSSLTPAIPAAARSIASTILPIEKREEDLSGSVAILSGGSTLPAESGSPEQQPSSASTPTPHNPNDISHTPTTMMSTSSGSIGGFPNMDQSHGDLRVGGSSFREPQMVVQEVPLVKKQSAEEVLKPTQVMSGTVRASAQDLPDTVRPFQPEEHVFPQTIINAQPRNVAVRTSFSRADSSLGSSFTGFRDDSPVARRASFMSSNIVGANMGNTVTGGSLLGSRTVPSMTVSGSRASRNIAIESNPSVVFHMHPNSSASRISASAGSDVRPSIAFSDVRTSSVVGERSSTMARLSVSDRSASMSIDGINGDPFAWDFRHTAPSQEREEQNAEWVILGDKDLRTTVEKVAEPFAEEGADGSSPGVVVPRSPMSPTSEARAPSAVPMSPKSLARALSNENGNRIVDKILVRDNGPASEEEDFEKKVNSGNLWDFPKMENVMTSANNASITTSNRGSGGKFPGNGGSGTGSDSRLASSSHEECDLGDFKSAREESRKAISNANSDVMRGRYKKRRAQFIPQIKSGNPETLKGPLASLAPMATNAQELMQEKGIMDLTGDDHNVTRMTDAIIEEAYSLTPDFKPASKALASKLETQFVKWISVLKREAMEEKKQNEAKLKESRDTQLHRGSEREMNNGSKRGSSKKDEFIPMQRAQETLDAVKYFAILLVLNDETPVPVFGVDMGVQGVDMSPECRSGQHGTSTSKAVVSDEYSSLYAGTLNFLSKLTSRIDPPVYVERDGKIVAVKCNKFGRFQSIKVNDDILILNIGAEVECDKKKENFLGDGALSNAVENRLENEKKLAELEETKRQEEDEEQEFSIVRIIQNAVLNCKEPSEVSLAECKMLHYVRFDLGKAKFRQIIENQLL